MIAWSIHSRLTLPRNLSHTEFIRGASTAVFTTRSPAPLATRSKTAPYLSSRSLIKNLGPSPKGLALRSCWAVHCGWGAGHRNVDHALGVHVDDEEREQWAEPIIVGLQEIAGPDGMVAQKVSLGCPRSTPGGRRR